METNGRVSTRCSPSSVRAKSGTDEGAAQLAQHSLILLCRTV